MLVGSGVGGAASNISSHFGLTAAMERRLETELSLTERAYLALEEKICTLELVPGAILPKEPSREN